MSITAYALGEVFNEPWHPNLLTSTDVAYPSDMLEFTVEAGGALTQRDTPEFFIKVDKNRYTTWKVDGATLMYWFLMAPY